jgi:uncharacterized repeat protein (TIGR02543 family)
MTAQSDNTTTALSANSFTYPGYTFSGWNTQANGSGTGYANVASYGFGASVTLYAQWTPVLYTVSFNSNGGTGSMASESSSTPAALSTNTLTRSGYTFSGWNTQANGSGTGYANVASYGFGASVTLYAQWTPVLYTVSFNSNGGTGSMASESSSTPAALSTNTLTRSGYTFSGWNTQANDGGTSYADGASYGFGSNVTLYAQWSASTAPTVTLSPTSQLVESGATATFSASASGSPTPSVQWEVSSNDGGTWSVISGATSDSYSFISTQFNTGYEYEAVFSNTGGTATSAAATLTCLSGSGNWAGYVAAPTIADPGVTFSAVSANWVVPTVTCSGTSSLWAVQWVGIDGWGTSTVEQDGTETNCAGSTPQYSAWYEMYGDTSNGDAYYWMVPLSTSSYPVHPGDAMTGSVQLSGDVWTLKVIDHTAGWTFSIPITDSAASAGSVEVITETPSVNGQVASLADFGTVTFTNISVTSSATGTGSLTPSMPWAVFCSDTSNGVVLMSPGELSDGGTSFSITWLSSS